MMSSVIMIAWRWPSKLIARSCCRQLAIGNRTAVVVREQTLSRCRRGLNVIPTASS